jgi:hypothetical protein
MAKILLMVVPVGDKRLIAIVVDILSLLLPWVRLARASQVSVMIQECRLSQETEVGRQEFE